MVCGKLIPYRKGCGAQNHNRKVVCPPPRDGDRGECYREYCRRNAKPKLRRAEMTPAQLKADKRRQQLANSLVKGAIPKAEKWQPKKKVVLMTDAQQRMIDREALERDARRMGLTRDPGRSVTGVCIKTGMFSFCALWRAGEITPINEIPDRQLSDVDYPGLVQSWCDSGGRRWAKG